MIRVNLKEGNMEFKGTEMELYGEFGLAAKRLHKMMQENHPRNPEFADKCFETLFKSLSMSEQDIKEEVDRFQQERPDICKMADEFLSRFLK